MQIESIELGWGLRVSISNKFQGDVDTDTALTTL